MLDESVRLSVVRRQCVQVNRECGHQNGQTFAHLTREISVFSKSYLRDALLEDCSTLLLPDSSDTGCTERCRNAVETYVNMSGCCVIYGSSALGAYGSGYENAIEDIFSACGVEIPEPCTYSPPPKEFLDCARESESAAEPVASQAVGVVLVIVCTIH